MSENKNFKMTKTIPGDVILIISPLSNPAISRTVRLTDRNPVQVLPLDYALGIFVDNGNYELYKTGCFTFDDNDTLVKLAYENGAYFDEKLDFTPRSTDDDNKILVVLKNGTRGNIEKAITEYGADSVKRVAIANVDSLTRNVILLLEDLFKVQLTMDGGEIVND